MARDFSKNTSNYMSLGVKSIIGLINGASATSLSAWVNIDAFETNVTFCNDVLNINFSGGNTAALILLFDTTSSVNGVKAFARTKVAGEAGQVAKGTTSMSTGVWYHVGMVCDYPNDRIRVYLNGVEEANTAVAFTEVVVTDSGSNTTSHDAIGSAMTTTPVSTVRQMDGRIAEVGLWNVDIGVNGFLSQYRGRLAWDVYPTNLVFYAPLWGLDTNEYDLKSKKTGTITGTVARANHAPVVPFSRRRWSASVPLIESAAATSPYYFRRYILGRRG